MSPAYLGRPQAELSEVPSRAFIGSNILQSIESISTLKEAIDKQTRTKKLVNRSVKNSTLLNNSLNARNDELVKKFERAVNNCTSIVEATENGALLEMRDLKSHYSN